jgi:hypothetical protein
LLNGEGEIPVGSRVRMSRLGASRCPGLAGKVGIVFGRGQYGNSVRVIFDGNRTPTSLHQDYLEPENES